MAAVVNSPLNIDPFKLAGAQHAAARAVLEREVRAFVGSMAGDESNPLRSWLAAEALAAWLDENNS